MFYTIEMRLKQVFVMMHTFTSEDLQKNLDSVFILDTATYF